MNVKNNRCYNVAKAYLKGISDNVFVVVTLLREMLQEHRQE